MRAAYDSVIREVLHAKMLRMGIGGNFLTTIQEFYHATTADLEVGGYVIGKVEMEVGLAQDLPYRRLCSMYTSILVFVD